MAAPTYVADAIVLRKSALGESDLVVRMMREDGSLLEAVAKGARKPQGSLSGRVELFNKVRVHCAKGRNLDVIKEARLLSSGRRLLTDPTYGAAAACIADFASKTIQPDLEVRSYFAMTDAALAALDAAEEPLLPAIVAAYVLKASAMMGMRPSFGACVLCGKVAPRDAMAQVSCIEGGFVCDDCRGFAETVPIDSNLLLWADALLQGRFCDLVDGSAGEVPSLELLSLAASWAAAQPDVRIKPLPMLEAAVSLL